MADHSNPQAPWPAPYLGDVWYCHGSLEGIGSFLSLSDNSIPGFITCEKVTPDLVSRWTAAGFAQTAIRLIRLIEGIP
jgi:hypothetical protein